MKEQIRMLKILILSLPQKLLEIQLSSEKENNSFNYVLVVPVKEIFKFNVEKNLGFILEKMMLQETELLFTKKFIIHFCQILKHLFRKIVVLLLYVMNFIQITKESMVYQKLLYVMLH